MKDQMAYYPDPLTHKNDFAKKRPDWKNLLELGNATPLLG